MAENLYNAYLTEEKNFQKKMQFLIIADKMKTVYRQTLLADKSRRETDAEHSWHLALMAIVLSDYAPEGTDIDKSVRMALVHDMVEIYAGDTFCYDINAGKDKRKRELEAADRLFSILPKEEGEEYKSLWLEFDAEETREAKFTAALDRLQPLINNFLTDGHTWRKGNVPREMVEKRVALISEAIPAAKSLVYEILDDSERKGYFRK